MNGVLARHWVVGSAREPRSVASGTDELDWMGPDKHASVCKNRALCKHIYHNIHILYSKDSKVYVYIYALLSSIVCLKKIQAFAEMQHFSINPSLLIIISCPLTRCRLHLPYGFSLPFALGRVGLSVPPHRHGKTNHFTLILRLSRRFLFS